MLVQITGAVSILVAFGAIQLGLLRPHSYQALTLNLAGSAALAAAAVSTQQWGFLLLEGCWAVISAWSLLREVQGHRRAAKS